MSDGTHAESGFDHRQRFEIEPVLSDGESKWRLLDRLSPTSARLVGDEPDLISREGRLAALSMLLPHCIHLPSRPVGEQPDSALDGHFWQFPAITERLAFDVHAALPAAVWRPQVSGPVPSLSGSALGNVYRQTGRAPGCSDGGLRLPERLSRAGHGVGADLG
jgi:hypothetical protein